MPALALFDALKDFAPRSHTSAARPVAETLHADVPSSVHKAPDIDAIVSQRIAVAETALRVELEERHAAALAALAEQHSAALAQLGRECGEQAGQTIARAIDAAETHIRDYAVNAMARAVGGVLSDEVQRRSLERLAITIRDAVRDRDAVRIRLSGPQSLYEPLRKALGDHAAKLDYAEAPGFDLTVSIDGELIETRLAEWSAGLSEILA